MNYKMNSRYRMNSPFAGFSSEFIFASVQQMYKYDVQYGVVDRLLNNDEEMDIYLMQIGAMPSEINVK